MPTLHLATFTCEVTPPLGHPLCGGWIDPVQFTAEAVKNSLRKTVAFTHRGIGTVALAPFEETLHNVIAKLLKK